MTDPHAGGFPERRLRALTWRASLATAPTLAVALTAIVDFVLTAEVAAFIDDVESGTLRRAELRERASDLEEFATALQITSAVFFVAAAVAWMVWLWAARRNAGVLDTWPFSRSQGWVIAGWLVPIVNLWFPKQIVDDTWLATERFLAPEDAPPPRRPLLVWAWWTAFVAYVILARVVQRMSGDTLDELNRLVTLERVLDGVCVLAAVLGVTVIWRITRRQDAAARQLSGTAAAA